VSPILKKFPFEESAPLKIVRNVAPANPVSFYDPISYHQGVRAKAGQPFVEEMTWKWSTLPAADGPPRRPVSRSRGWGVKFKAE